MYLALNWQIKKTKIQNNIFQLDAQYNEIFIIADAT